MTDCVKCFLKVKKSNSVNVWPISILQASNKAVTIEWSAWNPNFGARQNTNDPINGKELKIDNSFKYFANYRDNWYCTIIVYVASFAAY